MAEQSAGTEDNLDLGPPVESAQTQSGTDFEVVGEVESGTTYVIMDMVSTRDLAFAGAGLLAALIAFFFIKRAFELSCINRRVAPNKARLAGNALFIGLSAMAVGIALSLLDPVRFVQWIVMGPIALIVLISLVLTIANARR